jgi:predicted amino acid racemase
MNGEKTNSERAGWAENALNTYGLEVYRGRTFTATVIQQPAAGDDAYTMCQDLISDILHVTRRHGWDVNDMLRRARGHFEDEVAEEEEAG